MANPAVPADIAGWKRLIKAEQRLRRRELFALRLRMLKGRLRSIALGAVLFVFDRTPGAFTPALMFIFDRHRRVPGPTGTQP